MHDPDVIRWIGPPWPLAEVLPRNAEAWARHGSPTFAICDLDDTFLGLVWMNVRDPDPRAGFVGYWVLPAARRRGVAAAAVRLLSTWALRELGVERLRLTTAPGNERSQRVAENSGFRRLIPPPGMPLDDPSLEQVVFGLDRSELEAAGTET